MRVNWALEGGAQEVPADHEAKCFVYPFTSQAYEAATNGVCGAHLGDAVVDHGKEHGLDRVGEKQAARATMVQTSADAYEESCPDGASDGDKLDLAVVQVSLEVVDVAGHGPLLDVRVLGVVGRISRLFRIVILTDEKHLGHLPELRSWWNLYVVGAVYRGVFR